MSRRDIRRHVRTLRDSRPFRRQSRCGEGLLAVVEICALTQSRLGLEAVRSVQQDLLPVFEVIWVDEATHTLAMTVLLAARRRKLSLVDCVSFAVMRQKGSQLAFAFDKHFLEEGFSFPSRS